MQKKKEKKVIRICLNTAEKLRKHLKNVEAGHGRKEGSFKKHFL